MDYCLVHWCGSSTHTIEIIWAILRHHYPMPSLQDILQFLKSLDMPVYEQYLIENVGHATFSIIFLWCGDSLEFFLLLDRGGMVNSTYKILSETRFCIPRWSVSLILKLFTLLQEEFRLSLTLVVKPQPWVWFRR